MPCDFTERMERGRELALQRRNAGKHTGRMAKGWNYKRPDPEEGTFERARQAVVARWQVECFMAAEIYMQAVFPERYWDDRTIDDAIAERHEAERAAILETF